MDINRDLKDIIVIPVEESEESDAEDEGEAEDCSELASEESYGRKDQSERPTSSTSGTKRHGRRIGSASSGPDHCSRSRKRRRRKKRKVKHNSSSQRSKVVQSKNEVSGDHVNGESCSIGESRATGVVTEEEVLTKYKVKRVHSAPSTAFKRINRQEMVSSTQIKVHTGDSAKRLLENGMNEAEESTVMKLLSSPACVKTETNTRTGKAGPESSGYRVEKTTNATALKLSHRPWTAGATEVTSTYASPLNNMNGSVSSKQRSMLLALSKESYQRTLPPVLHTQSMNFTLDGSKHRQNGFQTRQRDARATYEDPVHTAVMKYANSKGVVLQKEVLSNTRFIPIVPDVDNTRIYRSNSFLRDISYNKQKQQTEKELSRSCNSLGPLSTLDRDLKPILKDSQNGKSFEKRKSVRFQVPEG